MSVQPAMGHPDQTWARSRWFDAAAILAVLATVLVTAHQLRPLAEQAAFLVRTGEPVTGLPWATWPRAAVWVAVSVAVLARWRVAAAVCAWAAALFEIAVMVRRIDADPGGGDLTLALLTWPLLLAVVTAVLLSVPVRAGLSSGPVRAGRGLDLLGRWGRWLLALAATGTVLTATAIPLLGEYYGPRPADSIDPGFDVIFAVSSGLARTVAVVSIAVVASLTVGAVLGLEPALRRRVLTLLGAGGAGFAAIQLALPRPFGFWEAPVLSPPTQALLLVIAPVLVLATGVLVIRFSERPPPSEATAVTLS